MPEKKTFYLTTPIYYVNARPHIGHAYSTIVADVLARRHRLLGDDTYFLTGTDEHGQKIERSAAAAGIPPQQFADQVSATFRALWTRMGILRDSDDPLFHQDYIRTTEPRHKLGVQKLFRELYNNGHIYLASYTGSYCVSDEAFVDAPVGTPCPDCGRLLEEVTEENFFFKLSAFQAELIDLIEPGRNWEPPQLIVTPDSSRNEVLKFLKGNLAAAIQESSTETNPLSEAGIDSAIQSGHLGRTPRGFVYVPGALRDLSISRSSFTWGIPVPDDIQKAAGTKQNHVIYVWLDALANYMTALGYGSDDDSLWQKFWPADLHLVGKEITRFHCVYWPAFLLAANLPTPKQVTANGWLLFDNSKMSKSKGNVVRTETILDGFGTLWPPPAVAEASARDRDLFAADVLRYYLLREIPFGQDGSFSFDSLITRYNADLANGYGNLVSRTLNMINKYFDGVVPDAKSTHLFERFGKLERGDYSMVTFGPEEIFAVRRDHAYAEAPMAWHWAYMNADSLETAFDRFLNECSFSNSIETVSWGVAQLDAFITWHAPWKVAAIDAPEAMDALKEIIFTAAQGIRIITALLYPILPYATARVWQQLGLGDIELAAKNGELTDLEWGGLKPGTKLGPLGPIFPRAPKELAQIMTDMENPTPATPKTTAPDAAPRTSTLPEPAGTLPVGGSTALTTGPAPDQPAPQPATENEPPTTPQITIDDFAKIELRVAQITLAERIPKADKLLRLEVDLGPFGQRQILSGIAEFYTPEELTGRRIVVITNLAPRKMRGLESHGMLLAASDGEHGKPHLATCGDEIALGSRLK